MRERIAAKRKESIELARRAYERSAWNEAFEQLRELDDERPLEREDLERLAWAAALVGNDECFIETLGRTYQPLLDEGAPLRAARAAFWVGFRLMGLGEQGRAAGWLGRCQRLVDEADVDCAEAGYLLVPAIYGHLMSGEVATAIELAARAAACGVRHGDADLVALARMLEGRARLRDGQVAQALQLFDEIMLSATTNELATVVTGLVYCSVIAACHRVYALDRAREWTEALAQWCDRQPELVTFRGACQIHRSEILQLSGDWDAALEQATRAAIEPPNASHHEDAGNACYQQGEIHRVRGELEAAERAYTCASEFGRDPQPGLSLLRAAQGRMETARAGLQRALDESGDTFERAQLLPAAVELALEAGDLGEARARCGELEETAARFESEVLAGITAHARGRLHLAEDDARAALGPLRRAFFVWQQIGAPYEAARARVALARACSELGDHDGARLNLDAARQAFEQLGAVADLARLDRGAPSTQRQPSAAPLTPRELEVLRLVATGMTNRAIAGELALSEKTIDRHVSNIFTKLDVGSRAAATAYAYEHGLVETG